MKDKVAIITGANRGIGRAIALGFAREGADVVVNYVQEKMHAEETVEEIKRLGRKALAVYGDVSDLSDMQNLVSLTVRHFQRIDVLTNNAGTQVRASVLDATPEHWDQTMRVNLRGPFFLSQLAAREMIKRGEGKIINIASIHDTVPKENLAIYAISKGGLRMMTRALALELAKYKINVNAISPGAIETDLNRDVLSLPAYRQEVIAKIPWKEIGTPEAVVGAAIFLASDEASYITGATIYADGGLILV